MQGRPDDPAGGLPWIGPFVFGTDGKGRENLIVHSGGMRQPVQGRTPSATDAIAPLPSPDHLHMNGPEIFTFALRVVPQAVKELLEPRREDD